MTTTTRSGSRQVASMVFAPVEADGGQRTYTVKLTIGPDAELSTVMFAMKMLADRIHEAHVAGREPTMENPNFGSYSGYSAIGGQQ